MTNRIWAAIGASDGSQIDDARWNDILTAFPCLTSISSCEIANPMTGDPVRMEAPPNLLAEANDSTICIGILRVGMDRMEIEFAGPEQRREEILSFAEQVAREVNGTVTEF